MAPTLTEVFGAAGGLALSADIYLPDRRRKSGVLLWFHGGALILGGRQDVPEGLLAAAQADGYPVVSADYRLAPQANLDDIVGDVAAALTWCQGAGAEECGWDGGAVVVAGLSAGGYLALRAGLMEPRPAAVVAWYGYGTLDSAWYTQPSAEHEKPAGRIDRAEALASIGDHVVVDGHRRPDAFKYYLYSRQVGQWPNLAAGVDFPAERQRLRAHSPAYHVTEAYPPAVLLHGTADNDVPCRESAAMAAMLDLHGVEHQLHMLVGLDHGLWPGADPDLQAAVAAAEAHAHAFIASRVHAS